MPEEDSADPRAAHHPIRARILALIAVGEDVAAMNPDELCAAIGCMVSSGTARYHCRVLTARGLLS